MFEMTQQQNSETNDRFEAVVDMYWDEILAYAWRMFSGAPEAEDCFQETFLRAFRAFPDLDQDANVRAWLYRIATNVARTQFKRDHDRRRREELSGRVLIEAIDPTHERVNHRITLAKVEQMIAALPVKQRAAFMLRKYQACSYEEIAEVLGCTREAARANVYQALRRLRSEVAESKVEQT